MVLHSTSAKCAQLLPMLLLLLLLLLQLVQSVRCVTLKEMQADAKYSKYLPGAYNWWLHLIISAAMLFGILLSIWLIVFIVSKATGSKPGGRRKKTDDEMSMLSSPSGTPAAVGGI